MFDPYHKWLGIPPGLRPPTHYQLLGIAPDEEDTEVIKEAALRQTTHVRIYQTGPHAEDCTRLLNEIAQARSVLLNRQLREEYASQQHQATAPPALEAVVAAPRAQRVSPYQLLAAAGYTLLLIVAFVACACLGFQAGRQAAAEPARAVPSKDRTP